ncbi:mate-domain-containing protein [Dunaliella salina]|uniref:Mate-domain-containing protein n=1 Tax=Dunaliella salina TaxID=3046 RepID=A0ABQ7GYV3_DUNSA|nr:mate-domain-containing protein [Dunaliella salina]|eukprot:KAF5839787.1 mate-domain-containing protein [Dunaliella salina]
MHLQVACPLAVGIAASIRVGNLLGAGQPSGARMFAWMCVAAVATFVAMNACIIVLTRHVIGRAFSEDEEVIKIMAMIAPIAALHQMSDGLMGSAQGVLRGCGRQSLLMFYNLGGFWGCGVLLGSTLCFKFDMGVLGLWIGIASGTTATAILNVTTLVFMDWNKESRRAQDTLIHAAGEPGQEGTVNDEELQSLVSPEGQGHRQA